MEKLIRKLVEYCKRHGCRVTPLSDFHVVVFDPVVGSYVCFVFSGLGDVSVEEIDDAFLERLLKRRGYWEVKVRG